MSDPFIEFLITEKRLRSSSAELYRMSIDPVLDVLRDPKKGVLDLAIIHRLTIGFPHSRRVQFRTAYRHLVEFAAQKGMILPALPDARKAKKRYVHPIASDLFQLTKSIRIVKIPRIRWSAYGRHTFDRYTPPEAQEVVNDGSFEVYIDRQLGERLFKWATGVEWARREIDLLHVPWQGLPLVPRSTMIRDPLTENEIRKIIAPLIREKARADRK